ncbi:MvaI/BcnI restriction endonuclease family protein [Lysobacter sp. SG-8]|uniref:MvaI/BcnI restriction endonuclease family protein n=1 Tax=Marilutibacter penaei TaxID=2759900 RepID=A0A7W3YE12_9GAMM|nr:MvaI/BcnI family restriction endonuclease [Lysobacter penaei]MBB1087825.1 MvaI/BcnI restriction endonuclease family protein [Lysobacter penaei]
MLATSDVSIQEVLRYFTKRGIEVGLLVPTETGMAKSIMDATGNVREFLRSSGLHDFEGQPQGQAHKRLLRTRIVTSAGIVGTQTSLYRPVTKAGDPRIWIYGLAQHASAGNLLALVAVGKDELLVINASNAGLVPGVPPRAGERIEIRDAIDVDLETILAPLVARSNDTATELLELLHGIAGKWHAGVPGIRRDTEVGRLLEELLGIRPNSSRSPDYKGIEIKAGRSRSSTRQTLFAKVPDWHLSNLKSSAEILDRFGYVRGDSYLKQLRCTVSARGPNTQGLFLLVPSDGAYLHEGSIQPDLREVATWRIDELKSALQMKHPETFWVTARSNRLASDAEEFRYESVLHTKKPIASALPTLLETGVVTVDHLITKNKRGRVREQGPLFRIWRRDMDLLFPPGEFHLLGQPDPDPQAGMSP